jgi:hypothetical protein
MYPDDNLFSQLTIYSPPTTPDDGQKDGQAHQVTQLSLSDAFAHPPGAEIIRPITSDHSRQAENSSLRPPTAPYYDYSGPESSPLPLYNQGDDSNAAPSPSHSISPVPRPSHVSKARHSIRKS